VRCLEHHVREQAAEARDVGEEAEELHVLSEDAGHHALKRIVVFGAAVLLV
jgi:hypothetical protein